MILRTLLATALYISATQNAGAESFDFKKIDAYNEEVKDITIHTLEGKHWENYKWQLTKTHIPVFLNRIQTIEQAQYEDWDLRITNPDQDYKGLEIQVEFKNGEKLDPFTVYDGTIKVDGKVISEDPNRAFEYWLFSLNTQKANQEIAARVLPIFTFSQCAQIGNPIIHTSPRQCLMANQHIFLDVPEKPTQATLNVTNFDECLAKGEAIIDTFPRRCIMAGGHVFTEPPRIFTPKKKKSPRFKTEDF